MLLRREFLGAIGVAAFGSIKERSVKVETVYKSPGACSQWATSDR
jgi:hypothetical protein